MTWQKFSIFLQPCLVYEAANRPSCYFIRRENQRSFSKIRLCLCFVVISHWASVHQDKFRKKEVSFLKFRSGTQLFLCRRNIMEHMCSSWLMDWLYLYCLCLSPHLMPCPSPGVHSRICSHGNDHLVTDVLLLRSTLHPPPPPDHHFLANPTMPISWPAGEWREVEVAPPIL